MDECSICSSLFPSIFMVLPLIVKHTEQKIFKVLSEDPTGFQMFYSEGSERTVTYNDEQDEVDEVVERVSVHHVVHDLHPAF